MTQHNSSRHSTPQSPEVAIAVINVHGAQDFRRVLEEECSNTHNQLAHVNFDSPISFGFHLEAVVH